MCTFFLVVAFHDARFLSGLYHRFSYIVKKEAGMQVCDTACDLYAMLNWEEWEGTLRQAYGMGKSGAWRLPLEGRHPQEVVIRAV